MLSPRRRYPGVATDMGSVQLLQVLLERAVQQGDPEAFGDYAVLRRAADGARFPACFIVAA